MSKGSTPRPFTNRKEFELNWDNIFKQKPHEGQFDGNVTDTSSTSKNEKGQLPTSADS